MARAADERGGPRSDAGENRSARQRAVVTVLTNEASFDELMNAYIERAFTWRQLARALAEQGGQPAERAALVRCFAASA